MAAIDVDLEPQLTVEDLKRFREMAEQNARALGLSADEWQRRRQAESPVIADILMACDPKPSPIGTKDGPKGSARLLGRMRIDELVAEIRDARRQRSVSRLNAILDELSYRKSRGAARLAASVRLSILALERPDFLPFSVL